jgi:hypothetical protein
MREPASLRARFAAAIWAATPQSCLPPHFCGFSQKDALSVLS